MSQINEVSVRTLEARIRIIQIENRQLTMGVLKQLDYGNFPLLDSYGRVKMSTNSEYDGHTRTNQLTHVTLIGPDENTGELVKMNVLNHAHSNFNPCERTPHGTWTYRYPLESMKVERFEYAKSQPLIVVGVFR